MGDLDVSDFNKARSFLLGWSVLIFCLWFFGADLDSFKLLGNEIKLTRNLESVWLLLACVEIYLLFRYFQRVPEGAFNFNREMNNVYDGVLRSWVRVYLLPVERRKIQTQQRTLNNYEVVVSSPRFEMKRFEFENAIPPQMACDLSLSVRASMRVEYFCQYYDGVKIVSEKYSPPVDVELPGALVRALKMVAVIKGVFVVSWFTDYLLPMVVGIGVGTLALYNWWVINL